MKTKKKIVQEFKKYSSDIKKVPQDELHRREKELVAFLFGDIELEPVNFTSVKEEDDAKNIESSVPVKTAAWVDDDDDIRLKDIAANNKARSSREDWETSDKRYELTLQDRFTQVMGNTPDWAQLGRKIDEEEDDEFARSTGNYLSSDAPSDLPKSQLHYKKLYDLNRTTYAEGGNLKAVEFNPKYQIGLVAGFHKTSGVASLFQVDGVNNHHIQTVKFLHFPVVRAKFLMDGRKFMVRSNYFNHTFLYDMEAGKEIKIRFATNKRRGDSKDFVVSPDGELFVVLTKGSAILVYEARTFTHIDTLMAPEVVEAVTFSSDGSKMYACGYGGNVTVWDMRSRVCSHVFYDDGCTEGTSIALSPNDQYLACGSSSGVVNIYDTADLIDNSPKPVKCLDKLLTRVTSLAFNPTSEILSTVSEPKENAIKLVHFPSMTYFQNFPKTTREFSHIQTAQFSPKGGYFAFGNNKGTAYLYRLLHYNCY